MIKVTMPDGTTIEVDTAAEAATVLAALHSSPTVTIPEPPGLLTPEAYARIKAEREAAPKQQPRTRKIVRNWELDVLEAWTMEHPDPSVGERRELGRRLGRTPGGTNALLKRYRDGVYSISSPHADDAALYNEAKKAES